MGKEFLCENSRCMENLKNRQWQETKHKMPLLAASRH